VMVDELEATAPFIDQRYADPVALAVRAALTDAELFISYNMPAKALGPLMSALPQAPRDLRINQRLAALHTRAQRFTEAAVCCRTLESIYHEAGCPDEATRYGELAAKYEERAAQTPALSSRAAARVETAVVSEEAQVGEIAEAAVVPAPAAAAEEAGPFFHAAEAQAETAEFAVQAAPTPEIDLSAEWEEGFTEAPAAGSKKSAPASGKAAGGASEAVIADAVEEIRFYLANGMAEEAQAAFRKLEQLKPDAAKLEALRAEIEAARKHAPAAEAVSVEVAENSVHVEEESATPEPAPATLDAFVSDLESSLGDGFLPQTTAQEFAVKAETEPVVAAGAEAQPAPVLNALVSDLESSLGDSFLAEAPVAQPTPAAAQTVPAPAAPEVPAAMAAAAAAAPAASPTFTYQPATIRPLTPQVPGAVPPAKSDAGVDLADMFGELKHELEEETTSAEEDPETHYNLGVAFREMGLLDEAIGELQKVCQWVEHGNPFPQIMQTYTWLAQCFLDKGVPEAAIRWYEKALTLPTLDADTRTALHYELASSYEVAGNKTAALSHFMEVYGGNIDYRDVAERIKTLKS
jgi:tetratricopeptide (TPR) repeat protein